MTALRKLVGSDIVRRLNFKLDLSLVAAVPAELGVFLVESWRSAERIMGMEQFSEGFSEKRLVATLAKPVADLNLSKRSRVSLNRLGISSLGDLVACTPDELLAAQYFGQTCLTEVREKLHPFGLSLQGD